MAIARTNAVSGEGSTSLNTVASSSFTAVAGRCLIALVGTGDPSASVINSIAQGANSFVQCSGAYKNSAGAGGCTDIWVCANCAAVSSTAATVTFNNFYTYRSVHIIEISGADTSSPFEVAKNGAASGTSVTSASFSPASAGNYNVAIGLQSVSGSNLWSAGSGYTLVLNTGSTVNSESEELVGAAAGSQTASISFSSSSNMVISVASFKAAAAAGIFNKSLFVRQSVKRSYSY